MTQEQLANWKQGQCVQAETDNWRADHYRELGLAYPLPRWTNEQLRALGER